MESGHGKCRKSHYCTAFSSDASLETHPLLIFFHLPGTLSGSFSLGGPLGIRENSSPLLLRFSIPGRQMDTASPLSLSPPPIQPAQASATIRRHHTISTATRSLRASGKAVISEEPQEWNEGDEEEEWAAPLAQTAPIGAVGEQKGLHRQASLPAGYTRELRHVRSSAHVGNRVNSLSAITAEHVDEEGADEGDWEQEIPWNREEDEQIHTSPPAARVSRPVVQRGQTMNGLSPSPISSTFTLPHPNSPPPSAGANVRRHQSLTYGAANSGTGHRLVRAATGSRRAGRVHEALAVPRTASPVEDDDETSAPSSPARWADAGGGYNSPSKHVWKGKEDPIGELSKALGALEMQTQDSRHGDQAGSQFQILHSTSTSTPPSSTPPRFVQSPGIGPSQDLPRPAYTQPYSTPALHLATSGQNQIRGPVSASPYVPPIGRRQSQTSESSYASDILRSHTLPEPSSKVASNDPLGVHGYVGNQTTFGYSPLYPNSFLDPSLNLNLGASGYNSPGMNSSPGIGMVLPYGTPVNGASRAGNFISPIGPPPTETRYALNGGDQETESFITSPIDIQSLIQQKGYNPVSFNTRPQDARYFVIKSYTEEDVHKSLKYEIWSSTDPGNKRLDKAFRENAGRGPIYLFFSVNASGHFCGVAEMLTPVDYTRTSTVWAQDKWKGVFKVRWIFVRDIPNAVLRGIRLENTQERKPVTNSRDTQELPKEAGNEMLRIFLTHAAKTSLLQDLAYYESKSPNKDGENSQPAAPQRHKRHYQQQQQQQQQQQTQRDQQPQPYYQQRQQSPPQYYVLDGRAENALLQREQLQQLLQPQQMQQSQGLHSPPLLPRDNNGLPTTPYDIQNQMNFGYFGTL
ncbi:YT521-B-like domain-containing protein [Cantharellus anzutake]|uniref:YT521-B-like domain-containing protein n=1 Tax=Cantharellus anzutake TaxID=1750568 RepID=UPI001906A335|nr:YT521-B-like domain-containing protein [Cantharellus anzutake]KAF8329972.1 YT521-B-like domain-containing protein [Cantharellus anzutake]